MGILLFEDVLWQWWTVNSLQLHPVTIYKKEFMYRTHILPWFGEMDILAVDDIELTKYIRHKLERGNLSTGGPLNANTIRKHIGIIKNVMIYAAKKQYISQDRVELIIDIDINKVPSRKFEVYSLEEVDKLIKVARPKWLGDMILLAYRTGMRKGEIFGLKWEDISFSQGLLNVVRSVSAYSPHNMFVKEPKSRSSYRTILLDDLSLEMLERRRRQTVSEWVFENQYGEVINPWYSVRYFRQACENADIPVRRFHDLRHTHITESVKANASLPIIQQRAGHGRIQTTMLYTHIKDDDQKVIIDYLNRR